MNKLYCEHLKDAETIFDTNSLFNWLQAQAKVKEHELKYLLAHANDGVIWGRFETDGALVTQTEPENLFPKWKFAKLDWSTLQQCRVFGKNAEVMLWKVGQKPILLG